MKCVRVRIRGLVQGVGFRYWTKEQATALGLEGWVRNRRDRTVEAVFQGDEAAVEAMIAACRKGPRFSNVTDVEVEEEAKSAGTGFEILPTS